MCAPTDTHLRIKLKCSILLTVRNRVMDLEVSVSKKGILHSNNGRILPRYSDIPLIFDWFDCGWTLYLLEKMR